MTIRTGGQFSRMDAQLPVPADPGRSLDEVWIVLSSISVDQR